jgi:hypothetical protein
MAAIVSAGGAQAQTYVNAHWWTPAGFEPGERHVRAGRFVSEPQPERVDLGGAYVVPPFAEAHNHNLDAPATAKAMSDTYLREGILYVKNPNSRGEVTRAAGDAVNGPDTVDAIFSAGGLTATGGHPVRLYGFLSQFLGGAPRAGETFDGDAFHLVRTEAEIAPALDGVQADGGEFVKIYLLHSEEHAHRRDDPRHYGARGLDPALVPDIVEAAHARAMRVVAHIETAADFRTATAAGVDEINHLPGYWWPGGSGEPYVLTDADARAAAAAGVTVVTTTGISQQVTAMAPTGAANLPRVQALQAANLKRLAAAGVKIAIGSDNYMSTARSEAENLIAIGAFTPAEVLRLWIDTGRSSIFPDRDIGRLQPGFEANFLVLEGDPLADFARSRAIRTVYKAGRAIPLPAPSAPSR